MTGGVKMLLGIAVGTVLFGLTSSLAWADGWSGCRGGPRPSGRDGSAWHVGPRGNGLTRSSSSPQTSERNRSDGRAGHQAQNSRA